MNGVEAGANDQCTNVLDSKGIWTIGTANFSVPYNLFVIGYII